MNVYAVAGNDAIARVYIAEFETGKAIEFVEAIQPPLPREKKWVLMVSTLYGCPVRCQMCDAGGNYQGKLSREEIFSQIDYLVHKRFGNGHVPVEKFKIQFARMGEPSFNPAVLDVLAELPSRYSAPGLLPSLSTIGPRGAEAFFDQLIIIKDRYYPNGQFQFQFSLHTTDMAQRDKIIPVKKWSFAQMAEYGERFYRPGDRKITLNFALANEMMVDPDILAQHFDPARYLLKITPLNPTCQADKHGLTSYLNPFHPEKGNGLVERLSAKGYEVIVAIGEVEENQIGSNCGQYLSRFLAERAALKDSYTYEVQTLSGFAVS
jgi:23S rRNA (adenine2503-C2)-methyltransferase